MVQNERDRLMYIDQIDPYAEIVDTLKRSLREHGRVLSNVQRETVELEVLELDLSRVSQCLHFHRMQWFLWRRCVFTARRMKNEAGELHLHEL